MSLEDKIRRDAEAKAAKGPADKEIIEIRDLIRQARDLELEKANLEEKLKETNIKLSKLVFETMPAAFVEIGISEFSIAPDGNLPGYDAAMSPYYKASISADWPEERRNAALKYLKQIGHEDLIKTEVVASFGRHDRKKAMEVVDELRNKGVDVDVQSSVHWGTLTSWLKEQVERKNFVPDLEKIGGTVGRLVRIKPKKDI